MVAANTVVEFTYHGGSKPGEKRRVYVTETNNRTFYGYDFNRQSHRRFLIGSASGLKAVPTKVVDTSILPIGFSVAHLSRAYENDGYDVYVDGSTIVAYKPTKGPSMAVTQSQIVVTGPGGKMAIQTGFGRLSIYQNGQGINCNPDDPIPLYEALKMVLGY